MEFRHGVNNFMQAVQTVMYKADQCTLKGITHSHLAFNLFSLTIAWV